ncbi:sensor histidine kinase [Pseudomonas japonica]|uniref:sensor histidine kinase n=1 Tax=Pseudomonas japonica TaxID=256466 RepID=UPI0015E2CF6C|nr:sensor histidine kinase [Pseudomonas japonica]MBA1289111.1 sensor histidine kinase [Pseudomonas japonica]
MPATTPTSALARGPWSLPLVRRLVLAGGAIACMTIDGYAWATAMPFGTGLLMANLAFILLLSALAWAGIQADGAISMRPEELAGHITLAREGERERLGRELHDDIGQLLTAARLQLDWLGRRTPASLAVPLATLRETLAESLNKVRNVSALLSPQQLAMLGLEGSLRQHLCKTLAGTGLSWSLECRQRLDGLPEAMSVAAFRIVQEGVTNLLRHAGASNLWIDIARAPHGLVVRITDDGEGFDTLAVPPGRGLSGMAERAQALRGHVKVVSAPGSGTRIEALLPWPDRATRRAARAGA